MEDDRKMLNEAFKALGKQVDKQYTVFDALVERSVNDTTYFLINNRNKKINITSTFIYQRMVFYLNKLKLVLVNFIRKL